MFTDETSLGSDVPKLNLALWTSRSPGSSDLGDKTLTPVEKPRKSPESSTSTSQADKTLTPSEQDNRESSRRGSRREKEVNLKYERTSRLEKIPSKKKKVPPAGRKSPADKHPSLEEENSKETEQIHLGSGDFVPKRKSPEKTSQVSEDKRRSKKVSPSSSSTSYMSLPNKLLSAITDDLRSLLSLTRRRQTAGTNPLLAHYISRLLEMSRQSVERLNVVTSEIPTPPSAVFRNVSSGPGLNESEQLVSSATDATNASSSSDSSELVTVMRQCHARISGLSQMIEKVRQENVISSPMQRKSPSFHFDSTAYLSPPSSIMPSPQVSPFPFMVESGGKT